ncbi:uncharacterized protein LOC120090851 [Benincasa hispida]|uniref:uncharacterized protein LOC120090851 n=1 Tax=Benincasa hispida TaxID=102211 RepID=UPI0018FF9F9A|nr:uncharacterized protein LOC120090851 [Benincasa hispida]
MAVARYDIEKFDGKGEFGLWKAKIKAILGQQRAHKAVEDPTKLPTITTEEKRENIQCIKTNSYKDVKTALKYGREFLTTGIIISALKIKEMELLIAKKINPMLKKNKQSQLQPQQKNQQSQSGEASVYEDFYFYSDALATLNLKADEGSDKNLDWVLDSRCSFHMTPHKDWLSTYRDLDGGSVYMGNNNSCPVVGISSVSLKLEDRSVKLLRNVRHVPKLKRNLISLGMCDSIDCEYRGKEGYCEVLKNSFVHQNKGKLAARAVKCMFLGFIEGLKGFRMWHPIEKRCITSRDFIFRETKMFMQKPTPIVTTPQGKYDTIEVEQVFNTTTDPSSSESHFDQLPHHEEEVEDAISDPEQEELNLRGYSLAKKNYIAPFKI